MASAVGPTHAAAPGIQGHPGNSSSGGCDAPKSHMRTRYSAEDSSPLVANSQSMARAWTRLPSWAAGSRATRAVTHVLSAAHGRGFRVGRREAEPPGQSPTCFRRTRFAEASLHRATAKRAANRNRLAAGGVRRPPTWPGWRRPWAPSRKTPGRRANRHPDSVCSAEVGSTWGNRGWRKAPRWGFWASHLAREHQRTVRRLRRRERSMTSVTPAPSQTAPCRARYISFSPFVVWDSLCWLPGTSAGPPPFQKEHHDAPCRDPDGCLHNCVVHLCVRSFAFHPNVFIIVKRYLKTCRMPGPAATISMDGNMKKKIGNTSLTPTLPARSSASWRRRTRKKSECVRRLSPMLVPKRSF